MKVEDLPQFDSKYLDNAVAGILKTLKRTDTQTDLLETNGRVLTLTFSLHQLPPGVQPKPLGITLPHPLYLKSDVNVCLIVRDPQRTWKDLVAQTWKPEEMCGLQPPKIIGLSKLKKNYPTMAARRQLMRGYDIFLCDTHIADQMPRILGRTFIDAGKLPIDVKVKQTNFLEPLKVRLAQSFLRLRTGTSVSVKIGHSNDPQKEICANALRVIQAVAKYFNPSEEELASGPSNVYRANQIDYIHLTATDCPSLPIYINKTVTDAVKTLVNESAAETPPEKPAKKRKTSKH